MVSRRSPVYQLGEFLLEPDEHRLTRGDQTVSLRPKAYDVLLFLVENHGHLVTKEDLFSNVWPDAFVSEGTLRHNVWEVREALADHNRNGPWVETIPKVGYKFVGQVEELKPATSLDHRQMQGEATQTRVLGWNPAFVLLSSILFVAAGATYLLKSGYLWVDEFVDFTLLEPVSFTSAEGMESFPSFSPDGSRVAYVSRPTPMQDLSGHICVKQIGTESVVQLTGAPAIYQATAWSPDGEVIAYIRPKPEAEDKMAVCLIPSHGGLETEIGVIDGWETRILRIPLRPNLAWTPDSRWLVVADEDPAAESFTVALFLLSRDHPGEKHLLTSPFPHSDVSPALSPNGRTLAFVRSIRSETADLYLLPLTDGFRPAGEPRRLSYLDRYVNHPVWTADGQEIIFSAGVSYSSARLWRINPSTEHPPQVLPFAWASALDPAISPTGDRLIYQMLSYDSDIYQSQLTTPSTPAAPSKLIASSHRDTSPTYSPDGSRIAFISDRFGSPDVYVCNRDGGNRIRLTYLEDAVADSPRWSPDGTKIAFEAVSELSEIHIVSALGGEARRLTEGAYPRWSPDGKWIYFWKRGPWRISYSGGEVSKTAIRFQSLRTVQTIQTWPEEDHLEFLPRESAWWQPTANGTYYSIPDQGLYHLDLQTREAKLVTRADSFTVSPDGASLLYPGIDNLSSDLMLVDDFH